ncbi:MAG TPA: citrate/2-methylcitrate synthase, partial [Thermoanaerobaculia bacterium]|nr:citrate/2-methylcitrate synthase [Thermoanaerobaculia bacterium]
MPTNDSLTITDNRTGKSYEVPISDETIRATDLRKIKVKDDDFGLMTYDPAFMNTAACRSAITFIDGDKGILEYRGYPIEQLAEKSTYLETAWLLLNGELPTKDELAAWTHTITYHTFINENLKFVLDSFRYNAHPMGMLIAMISALGTFYPEAKNIFDREVRKRQIERLVAKMITIAGFGYRHMVGMPYAYPDNKLSYPANFLNMMYRTTEAEYEPNPALVHALDVLFIIHADH